MVRALTAYRLRMATRCTPFGLMAGVAAAEFAPSPAETAVRLGSRHRRLAGAERGWLAALVRPWAWHPVVLSRLRVTANNLCTIRGDRLVLPYLPHLPDSETEPVGPAVREVTVRHTEAVRAALAAARTPIQGGELERRLVEQFPTAPTGAIGRLLGQLVEKEILLTELRPPAESPDATRHVLDTLAGTDPSVLPALSELREVNSALTAYAAQPLGEGLDAWSTATARMRRMLPLDRLVQVDLALDADVRLPPAVAAEAERAAELLWRLAPPSAAGVSLEHYHKEFVGRFGVGRAVPVLDVLDPDAGLGAPAGYLQPPSPRTDPPFTAAAGERDRLMLELAQDALVSGTDDVVLTDGHPLVTALSDDKGARPASIELFTRLLAESPEALAAGQFRLIVMGGSLNPAVASFGRFAHLLPDTARAVLADVARAAGEHTAATDAIRAQLVFQARHGRGDNVSQVPQWLDHRVPVGVFADTSEPGTLALENLALCADPHRLFVVDTTSGREIVPTVLHKLDTRTLAPNAARLLGEVARTGVRVVHAWEWGRAEALPYVPRVSYGRTVLRLARWRPAGAVLDRKAPFDVWVRAVHTWRRRWRVPERVCLSYLDQRLELHLTEPLHLRLFRHELGRRPAAVLHEVPEADGSGTGWLTGPGGSHRNELIIPLVLTPAEGEPAPPATGRREIPVLHRSAPQRTGLIEHIPGGEWLYACVYCAPERQNELLIQHLPSLLDAVPPEVDRWFFIRYGNPDHHLRLRFHGTPESLAGGLLPAMHRWAAGLRAQRLIQGLRLDTYDPELERYGGPEAITAAERVFHADSLAALTTLALAENHRLGLDRPLLSAVSAAHLAEAFWTAYDPPTDPGGRHRHAWADRLLDHVPQGRHHKAFQRRRREALALIEPYGDGDWDGLRAHPGGKDLLEAWLPRATALADYARVLRELNERSWTPAPGIPLSLLHMHHNRLTGIDSEAEQASMAIVRGAVQAHRDRVRRTS